jgi:hypothetical protein
MAANSKQQYTEFLEGKKIALVGPAQSIEGSSNGKKIDDCDIVVRLNYAKIKNEKDSGSRTDIIYYDGSFHNHSDSGLKFLVCSYPESEWFFESRCRMNVEYYKKAYNHRIMPKELYGELKSNLDTKLKVRPNTGLIAIVDLLKHNIESLFITGVDFYKTAYLSTHPDYGNKPLNVIKTEFKKGDNGDYHDTESQYRYFVESVYNNDKVSVDPFLDKIIQQEL